MASELVVFDDLRREPIEIDRVLVVLDGVTDLLDPRTIGRIDLGVLCRADASSDAQRNERGHRLYRARSGGRWDGGLGLASIGSNNTYNLGFDAYGDLL